MRSKKCSKRLTEKDAAEVRKRRAAGEAVHEIATAFHVNPGRISEILHGRSFAQPPRMSGAAN